MQLKIDSKGDFRNVNRWLKQVQGKSPDSVLGSIGREGVDSLRRATPVGDTGQTAQGWDYMVSKTKNGSEVAWINTAHPHTTVSVAKLIDMGHATGTGGYVPPRPYIKQALEAILKDAGDRVGREMFK